MPGIATTNAIFFFFIFESFFGGGMLSIFVEVAVKLFGDKIFKDRN